MNRVDEIEYMIACNELTAAQVFTQMRQLIPNKNIEAERDALKIELMRTEAALRACYNASAGALNLVTSDRQPKLEGEG